MPGTAFDAIASTTLQNYSKKLADNVSNNVPFYKLMKSKDKLEVRDGGRTIVEPLLYGENDTVTSFTGLDQLSTNEQQGIDAAEYNWKQVGGTIVISHTDLLKNTGRDAVINLLDARIQQAEITVTNKMATMIFGDGTGNAGKDFLGLDAIVSTTPAVGILGGIDRSNPLNAFWRNKANVGGFSFAAAGPSQFSSMVRQLTRGMDKPDLIVVGSDVYGYMQGQAFNRTFFDNPKLADMNFQALKFEGIDVIFDSTCPSDRAYFLNTKYLKLVFSKMFNYKVSDFIPMQANGQLGKIATIEVAGQLVANNCFLQGVIDNIAA